MSNTPSADIAIDERLVRELLAQQFPALADLPLSFYAHGWDNEMYRLGDGLLVRLPRRERSVPLMQAEIDWLPGLADHVTTYIPRPVCAGRPGDAFPYPWSVVPFVDGARASSVPLAQRTPAAEALADFLGSLHLAAPATLPDNPVRGQSLDQPRYHGRVADLISAHGTDADALTARWRAWSAAPEWDGADLVIHGDLHPLNLLLDDDDALLGVIDWGDMTGGDPACDLSTAWLTFDATGRRAFIDRANLSTAYDPHVWERAKAWALYLGLLFSQNSDDYPPLRGVGADALAAVLSEPV